MLIFVSIDIIFYLAKVMQLRAYCQLHKGSAVRLARHLKCKPSFIYHWFSGYRSIPVRYCIEIEKFTNGEVKCEDLCPDIDWAYLRNSATGDLSK